MGETAEVTLEEAGLYVFVCKLHPFMLAAVIADDPKTTGRERRLRALSARCHGGLRRRGAR